MKRVYAFFVKDMIECISEIEQFIGDMTYNEFLNDKKTHQAVLRNIEIIGEATKKLPKQIRQHYKDLPWNEMAKMRDKIIHWYFDVDYEIVWKVIKERLPEIKPELEKILKDINKIFDNRDL